MALSAQCQLAFSEQLLTLLNAGLPLLNSVQLIQSSAPRGWQPWLEDIQSQLNKGNSFSQSLDTQGDLFAIELINLIRVSERTGNIQLALEIITQQLDAQIQLKQKIRQALTYPITTLGTSFLLLIVMMVWVIPVFKEVFDNFQADLPPATKTLILISTTTQNYFIEILIVLIACIIALLFSWNKYTYLQKKVDQWALRIPLLGKLLRVAALQYWCRTLGHLLESGLPLPDALRVTAHSSNHWISHDLSAEVFKHITRGWPLGKALQKADPKYRFFDFETLQLLHISSESGFLAKMLNKRANTLSDQLSKQLNNLGQTLEPLLIILIGIIIGGLVIILYLPIFQLGQIV
ncbi:type II secretion system F family protein [Polynucleobacter sp. MWH-UH25E]|uniref:type II secretion system F family protein n=1 Tax=Polynucleobacter sp. MWH-UH25E TaxID=1855616 RepID=UPI001BFE245F|nr:type II secretion system F family protein [Polynucleobacter sp. MWH-UH25E]QWD62233.1 type II secretion system F family protein [Polynucleobacter sp. MWH-UH25E]